jgi:hypothetical protein
MRLVLLFALMALLTGCATAASRPVCIPVVPYSTMTQRGAAEEMASLEQEGRAPIVRRFVEDYGELRARNRAACE